MQTFRGLALGFLFVLLAVELLAMTAWIATYFKATHTDILIGSAIAGLTVVICFVVAFKIWGP
jgi:uncharacterized membrane protein YGL010W